MLRQFDESLHELKTLLLDMGEKLEIAIDKSVKSLARMDVDLAHEVLENDGAIDGLED